MVDRSGGTRYNKHEIMNMSILFFMYSNELGSLLWTNQSPPVTKQPIARPSCA